MTASRTRYLPAAIVAFFALTLIAALRPPAYDSAFDIGGFAKLPVLHGGRIKPADTVARTSLLMLRGKQTVRVDGEKKSAIEWLLDLLYRPALADTYPVFEIDDPDVLGLMGIQQGKRRHYAFADLHPHLGQIEQQAAHAEQIRPEQRSRFQNAVVGLRGRVNLYQKLQHTIQIPGEEGVARQYRDFIDRLAPLMASHMRMDGRRPAQRLKDLGAALEKYQFLSQAAEFFPLAEARARDKSGWISLGQGLLDAMTSVRPHPAIGAYAALGDAWRAGDAPAFNQALKEYDGWLGSQVPEERRLAAYEVVFNYGGPFYRSMILYTAAFLLACLSWLWLPRPLNRSAFLVLILAFAVHTAGLFSRMVLQGRPPVTNLYSSAIFVGWVAVLLGIVLERLFRNGIGSAVAAAIGFATLIVAHHLTGQGDTLEMMRAVLDSNFWLATHVVTITIGYGSTFLSGTLAAVYVFRRAFERRWDEASAENLERMVYGVVCFSTFFSFLGTVLGGIWADQSWGRFWGWDPKENGALMIVLWNAFILHARVGRFASRRAVMMMAVFGNVITAFSWFGVNMLGIGLHSYGFMDRAFLWLMLFTAGHLAVMGLALIPDYAARQRIRQAIKGTK